MSHLRRCPFAPQIRPTDPFAALDWQPDLTPRADRGNQGLKGSEDVANIRGIKDKPETTRDQALASRRGGYDQNGGEEIVFRAITPKAFEIGCMRVQLVERLGPMHRAPVPLQIESPHLALPVDIPRSVGPQPVGHVAAGEALCGLGGAEPADEARPALAAVGDEPHEEAIDSDRVVKLAQEGLEPAPALLARHRRCYNPVSGVATRRHAVSRRKKFEANVRQEVPALTRSLVFQTPVGEIDKTVAQ